MKLPTTAVGERAVVTWNTLSAASSGMNALPRLPYTQASQSVSQPRNDRSFGKSRPRFFPYTLPIRALPLFPPSHPIYLTFTLVIKKRPALDRSVHYPIMFSQRLLTASRHPLGARSLAQPLSVRLLSTTPLRAAHSKIFASADEAVKDIKSGSIVLSGGFGLCGTPDTLIDAISKNPSIKDLTCVSNNAGVGQRGLGEFCAAYLRSMDSLDLFRCPTRRERPPEG